MPGLDSYTKLLLHMNGTDGSTVFTDSSASAHTVTVYNDAQIDTAQSKFGGAAGLFDGTGDNIKITYSSDFVFGSADFTIDCWIRPTNVGSGVNYLFGKYVDASNWIQLSFGTSSIYLQERDSGGFTINKTWSISSLSNNTWYHFALVRNGNTFDVYIDGTKQGTSLSYSGSLIDFASTTNIATGTGGRFAGHIDEYRISKGIARWTANFTPSTDEYSESTLYVTQNETISLSESSTFDVSLEKIIENETISVAETKSLEITSEFSEDITLAESSSLSLATSIIENETIEIFDGKEMVIDFTKTEPLSLEEQSNINITLQTLDEEETIYLSELSTISQQIKLSSAIKVISYNPLVAISTTDPVKLVKIDVTVPATPTFEVYTINAMGEDVKNAKDIIFNDTLDKLYISCADGKLLIINVLDYDDRTIKDFSVSEDLQFLAQNPDTHGLYISTNLSTGQIITFEEFLVKHLATDIRTRSKMTKMLQLVLNLIHINKLQTDIRLLLKRRGNLNTDIRFLAYEYGDIPLNMVDREDIRVYVDGIELTDVLLDSIIIQHQVDAKSTASLRVARIYDNIDYKLSGAYSQISNQNLLRIDINGVTEIEGRIQTIKAESESQTVALSVIAEQPAIDKKSILLPLSILNTKLHPYDVLLHNVDIDNSYEDTRVIIRGSHGKYWTSTNAWGYKENSMIFATYALAQTYIDGNNTAKFIKYNPSATNYDDNIKFYKGVQAYLGIAETQKVLRSSTMADTSDGLGSFSGGVYGTTPKGSVATAITEGTFEPKQNWTYFWGSVTARNILTGFLNTAYYIGTSLGAYSSDLWDLLQVRYRTQRIYENQVVDLGYYYVGDAPYKQISPKNGKLSVKPYWEDGDDGLYEVLDEHYNYVDYVKTVADLEYEKLKNINGDILPEVSSVIELTMDGYYYYKPRLLSRINISNTIQANRYFDNNGFPVSVKEIILDTSSMRVTLNTSNQLSTTELRDIEAQMPDEEDYLVEKSRKFLLQKYDPRRNEDVK